MTEENMDIVISKELLEEIRHELVSISGLKAFDYGNATVIHGNTVNTPEITFSVNEMINLDYNDLITKIDKVLKS